MLDQTRVLLASQRAVGNALVPLALDARELHGAMKRASQLSKNWIGLPPHEMQALLRSFMTRATLSADGVDVTIGVGRLALALGAPVISGNDAGATIDLSVAAKLRRSGQGKRMVIGDPYQTVSDTSLVDVMKEAVAARQKLLADTDETLNELTERITKSKGRLSALMRLSYLAPHIIGDILAGRQPPELSVKRLLRTSQDLPLVTHGTRLEKDSNYAAGLLQVAYTVDAHNGLRRIADGLVSDRICLAQNIRVSIEGLVFLEGFHCFAFGIEDGANGARPIVFFQVRGNLDKFATALDENRRISAGSTKDVIYQGKVVVLLDRAEIKRRLLFARNRI